MPETANGTESPSVANVEAGGSGDGFARIQFPVDSIIAGVNAQAGGFEPAESTGQQGEGTPEASDAPLSAEAQDLEPYHKNPRWQQIMRERDEARQRADALEAFAPLIDNLRGQGINDGQTVLQQLREQEAAQARAREEAALADSLAEIDDQVAQGYLDPQHAERLKQAERVLATTQRQQALLDNQLRDLAITKARAEMPYLTDDVTALLATADASEIPEIAKMLNQMVQTALQAGNVEALRQKKDAPPAPLPAGGGSTALPAAAPGRPSFMSAFGHLLTGK